MTQDALPIGTVIGDFEIRKVLGKGGFGIVYEAYEPPLDRRVALKEYFLQGYSRREGLDVLPRDEESVPMFESGMARFIREARLLSMLNERTRTDGALVAVYRVFQAHRTAFMAMKLYEGQTLRKVVQADPAIVTEAWLTALLRRMLDALQALHSVPGENLVHRDVSPDNIVIQPDGTPVLLDFGATRNVSDKQTSLIYKPGYSPIEQYTDAIAQGPWTDLYALCGTAYFAIGRQSPLPAVDRYAGAAFEPASVRGEGRFSPQFLALIDHGMEVMPEQRFRSAEEMRAAIDRLGSPSAAPVAPAPATAPAADNDDERTLQAQPPGMPGAGAGGTALGAYAATAAAARPATATARLDDTQPSRPAAATSAAPAAPVPPPASASRRTALMAAGAAAVVGAIAIGVLMRERSAPSPSGSASSGNTTGGAPLASASSPQTGSTPTPAPKPASQAAPAASPAIAALPPIEGPAIGSPALVPGLRCSAQDADWACVVEGLARLGGTAGGVTLRVLPASVKIGEPIALEVVAQADGLLQVLAVDDSPQARLSVVFPNPRDTSNRVKAGATLRLPRRQTWDMVAQPPAGRSWMIAVLTPVAATPQAVLRQGATLQQVVDAFGQQRVRSLLGVPECTPADPQCPKTLSIHAADFIIR